MFQIQFFDILKENCTMKNKPHTFQSIMNTFGFSRDLRTVFADFLTLTICAFSQNPETKLSYHEDEYLAVIGKYEKPQETDLFPKLLGALIVEMEELVSSSNAGPDVLGNFFELHVATDRKAQFFTPWHVCMFMASITGNEDSKIPLSIIDPTAGSGRMLLAKAKIAGKHHYFYGIDIDPICVQMTVLNLFLNGIFHAEVMQANALNPHDFVVSYRTSFLPFGIFKITEKTQSRLWNMHQNSFNQNRVIHHPLTSSLPLPTDRGEQMSLF